MIRFYGSKGKIAKKYPKPKYDLIIEPFAGSAKYSLLYWEKDVVLIDIDPKIMSIWRYLKQASPKDILSLPDVPNATVLSSIDGYNQLSDSEKWLIGFCCNGGSAQPKNVSGRMNFNSWNRDKINISENLFKIRHWNIIEGSWENILYNYTGTWFIDPPYKDKGKWYKYHDINYEKLSKWCLSRNGQIIVCENDGAIWLPFKYLIDIPFSHYKNKLDFKKTTREMVFEK